MATILSFRAKAKAADGSAPEGDFLHHEDQTLSFQVTETGGPVVLGEIKGQPEEAGRTPSAIFDWTNQELADLYRVKRMLDAAGVPNALDRGLTDEGDPWMVFVGGDGEVFIHLCRLDGIYVLDSPNLKEPLRGADFNGLIESFTQRSLPRAGTEADPEERVVRITRGGKVRLHPSALLAALIWTLFLASEELVLRMPEAEEAEDGLADLEALGLDHPAAVEKAPMLVSDSPIALDRMAERDGTEVDPRQLAAQEAFLRDHSNGHHQNSYGMGLSTIAIAFGFMAEQSLTDAPETDAGGFLLESADESADEEAENRVQADKKARQAPEEGAETAVVTTEMTEAEARSLAKAEAEAASAEADEALDAAEAVAESKAFTENLSKAEEIEVTLWVDADYPADPPQSVSTSPQEAKAKPAATATATKEEAKTEVVEVAKVETSGPAEPVALILSSLRTIFQPSEMTSYSFGNLVVESSFDLSALDTQESGLEGLDGFSFLDTKDEEETTDIGSLLSDPPFEGTGAPSIAPDHRSFDSDALAFMSYLIGKDKEIEMIAIGGEQIILIDSEALASQNTSFITWVSSDGSLTSILGLQSEFQDFGLLA